MARSHGKRLFYVPGGKRERGESDETALAREIREELDCDVVADSLQPAGAFEAEADGKSDGTRVRVTCYFGDIGSKPRPAAEIAELAWFAHADIERCSLAGRHILDALRRNDLID